MNNFLLVHDNYHNKLPTTLKNIFSYTKDIHSHNTRGSKQQHLSLPKVNIQTYGINSIKYQSIIFWNSLNSKLWNHQLPLKKKLYFENLVSTFIINNY